MNPEDKPMNLALMRFSLLDGSFLMEPGCSMFMRQNKSEWFIDTDCDTLEGRIYISKEEFVDMARLVKYIPVEEMSRILEENSMLREQNERLSSTINTLRGALANDLLVNLPGKDPTQELSDADTSDSGDTQSSAECSDGDSPPSVRLDGPNNGEELRGVSDESSNGEPDSLLP